MNVSSRQDIIAASLDVIRAGRAVSFDVVAKETGLTKPGILYHFKTKKDLMIAVVDSVAEVLESEMEGLLGQGVQEVPVAERVRVYFEVALTREADPADMAMYGDNRLREELTGRWTQHMDRWFADLAELPVVERGTLTAVRLMADGLWFASATSSGMPSQDEIDVVRQSALSLLGGGEK